ncbi:MAG TPA: prepilin peptidase [Planctomycetota bacterium]
MNWWEQLREQAVLYPLFLGLFGAVAGSFASAAAYRMPREDLSLLRPVRSMCPACQRRLAWYENLPLLGWVLLRGRCAGCKAPISWTYLLHEVGLAALFVVAGRTWAPAHGPLALVLMLLALTGLWIAAAIDWKHLILPDELTLGGIPFGMAASALVPAFHLWDQHSAQAPWGVGWTGLDPLASPVWTALASSAIAAAAAGAFLFGLRALFSYLLRQEALGLGDVKYLMAVGALLGLEGSAWTLLVGVLVGAVLGVCNIIRMTCVVYARRRKKRLRKGMADTLRTGWMLGRLIPFGPSLVVGTMLVLLAPLETRRFFLESWPKALRDFLN